MIFESKHGKINVRETGTAKKVYKKGLLGQVYQHTIHFSFKGKQTQFQYFSFERKLDNEELLQALMYFIEDGTGSEKGFEQFCIDFAFDTWGFMPEETDSATGYNKKSLEAFKACKKRRVKAERMGITINMAYEILEEIKETEYSHRGDVSFIAL